MIDPIEVRVTRRMRDEPWEAHQAAWRTAEKDQSSPQRDLRLSIRARGVCCNAGLFTRHDVRVALEHESWLRCARNCGPVTLAEMRRWLDTTNDVVSSWDERFGVAV